MCYVGSAVDIYKRKREHLCFAKNGHHGALYKAIRKYGESAFHFEVLDRCERKFLLERERFYIALLDAASISGFNTHSVPWRNETRRISPITAKRISVALTGKKLSPEHCAKISAFKKGFRHTPEAIRKISEASKNQSLETRAKQVASRIGRKMSAETRMKISAARTGIKFTAEHRAKLSTAKIGKKQSPEHIESCRMARIGKRRSSEFCALMSRISIERERKRRDNRT